MDWAFISHSAGSLKSTSHAISSVRAPIFLSREAVQILIEKDPTPDTFYVPKTLCISDTEDVYVIKKARNEKAHYVTSDASVIKELLEVLGSIDARASYLVERLRDLKKELNFQLQKSYSYFAEQEKLTGIFNKLDLFLRESSTRKFSLIKK